jgi:hypothetical protein
MNRQVLAVNLWACPSLTAHRIRDFVVNLVSANNSCVVACLDLLVRSFVPPQSPKLDEEAQQKYAARKVSASPYERNPRCRRQSSGGGNRRLRGYVLDLCSCRCPTGRTQTLTLTLAVYFAAAASCRGPGLSTLLLMPAG